MRPPAEYPKESTRSRRLRFVGVTLSLLVTAAALGMVVVLWTGAGAHYESFAHAERLPWPHEGPAPLPGVAAPFDITTPAVEPSRLAWGTSWDATRWQVIFVGLMICAIIIYLLERKRSLRIEPLALLAACLALSAAYGLAIEADALAVDEIRERPPFMGYRMVQEGVGAVIVLQIVTAVVASISLIRIARNRARSGLSLALCSLFSAPYTFWLAEILFLAPYHMDASHAVTDMQLARAENAAFYWGPSWGSEWRIAVGADGQSFTRYSLDDTFDSPVLIEYEGTWRDVALLEAIDEIVQRFPEDCWITPRPSARYLDADVVLEIDESVRFERVRPILARLRKLRARNLQVLSPSPAALGPPFVLRVWFELEDTDGDTKAKLAVIELTPSASADAPAEVLFEGVRYEHAGAASATIRARHDGDEFFNLQVDDGVPWRDVVHAMDAFGPRTRLDP